MKVILLGTVLLGTVTLVGCADNNTNYTSIAPPSPEVTLPLIYPLKIETLTTTTKLILPVITNTTIPPERVVHGIIVISPQAAAALIDTIWAHPGFMIIDLRESAEHATGHIAGAVNISLSDPEFVTKLAALDREGEYIIYGSGMYDSKEVRNMMEEKGFLSVAYIAGGYAKWVAAGMPWTVGS